MGQETDFFSRPVAASSATKVSSATQKERDDSGLLVLQSELKKAQDLFKKGAPSNLMGKDKSDYLSRIEADIAGLNREIYVKTGGKPPSNAAPVAQQEQDFFTKPLGVPEDLERKAAESPYIRTPRIRSQAAIAAQQPNSPESIQAGQQREQEGTFLKNMALGGASLADTTIGGILPMAGQVVQAVTRPFTTPERAAEIGGAVISAVEKPFGKAVGAVGNLIGSPQLAQGTESPAYQNEFTNQLTQIVGQYGNKAAEVISQKFNIPLPDAQNMVGTLTLGGGVAAGKGLGAVGRGIADVKNQLGEQFAARQQAARPNAQPVAEVPQPYQSGGAAATAHENAVKAAIAEARPDLQAELAGRSPKEITPQDLKAIEVHNKFAKVDPEFVPTEGQATGDIAKLSDEYNQKALPGNEDLRAKFEQRDPMLIKGFNNIKEQFAPEHSGVGLQGKANNILEDVKVNKVDVDNQNIKNAYTKLEQANNGKFPVDAKKVADIALEKLNASDDMDFLPDIWKKRLEDFSSGAKDLNLNKYENLRTQLATARRAEKDGNVRNAIGHLQDALEKLPLTDESAIKFKGLADEARGLFRAQKEMLDPNKPTYNKLYSMAYEDNRTSAEMLMGNVQHPASSGFFENFVTNKKTSPADLSRAIELVGKDSAAHHEIIAGLADHLKQKAGVIDDKGNVSQAALRKELNKIGSNLDLIAGPEVAERLRNIGDVAEMSEHVKNRSGGSANVSQTAITSEREAATKAAKDLAVGATKAALNLKTGGASGMVESVLSPIFEAKKAKKAAEATALAQQEKLQQSISRSAGISKPTRIELRGMANKE
jgi:hypothetical protein